MTTSKAARQLPLGDRTLAGDMLAALKAIRRWCDLRDTVHADVDKVRSIRLVADDYLARAGVKENQNDQ